MAAPVGTAAAKKKLVVCGGNGFLGSRICKAAVGRGWDVTSISRSGEPSWPSVSAHKTAPQWSKDVTWRSANILEPATYSQDLEGADAVVHSMGILLEADYKGVVTGKESPIAGLQRAFSKTKLGADQNPLERGVGEGIKAGEKDGQLTYELMNRDSALTLAREANAKDVKSFAYISAAAGAPILPGRYISTKREAESGISTSFPKMRSLFIRPGFLYDSSRGFTVPMAAVTYGGFLANSLTGGNLTWLMGAGGSKPLKADLVAEAVVEGLADENVKGPVEVSEIEALATRAWRRGML
ncbi:NAD(P)-binding protein [Polychaeton citri CBS 116435]|uniref:NAD(P)-binding protein n=1 Tax=Polychaeton citri CBS 116435 TaxID=1314669 RepID=A0A9P4Q8M7_9PEZI|nr:NAD(P)-binding protein [Polychaeton citri CBS 116435]